MRIIEVTPEVFAAIWRNQMPGEVDENQILARVLKAAGVPPGAKDEEIGIEYPRYGVSLRAGFEIYRVYLGKRYVAHARGGYWVRQDTGDRVPSLNELSKAIGTKTENAWENWLFKDEHGREHTLSTLRDQTAITRRSRPVSVA
jgi:hypothetical protein